MNINNEMIRNIVLSKYDSSTYDITVESPSRLLLISDQHFSDDSESYFSDEAMKKTIKYLPKLVSKIDPNHIFILGDLFHGTQSLNQFCYDLMEQLNNLDNKIYLISGNHDRGSPHIYKKINFDDYPNIQYYSGYFIKLMFTSNESSDIYLTHDGGNGIWMTGEQKTNFVYALKELYEIPDKSWLISGHTHFPFIDYENKVSSLGCFNFDSYKHHKSILSYGILDIKPNSVSYLLHDFGKEEKLLNNSEIEKLLNLIQ